MNFLKKLFENSHSFPDGNFFLNIYKITGVKPRNKSLYLQAFRHSSTLNSLKERHKLSNERLEFLGDAVLNLVIGEALYHHFDDRSEGLLTNMRAKIVSRKFLNKVGKELELEGMIESRLDRHKPAYSLSGDALEALIGAIYLDRGLDAAKGFVNEKIVAAFVDFSKLEEHIISYKSTFIEWAQKEKKQFSFELIKTWGRKHSPQFKVALYIEGKAIATGVGTSKKRAEEETAKIACIQLNIA